MHYRKKHQSLQFKDFQNNRKIKTKECLNFEAHFFIIRLTDFLSFSQNNVVNEGFCFLKKKEKKHRFNDLKHEKYCSLQKF